MRANVSMVCSHIDIRIKIYRVSPKIIPDLMVIMQDVIWAACFAHRVAQQGQDVGG